MRIEIEIPKEFEEHFKQDKFEDTLHRLSADAHLIAGNYEQETAIMLIKAFKESKEAYDVEAVVAAIKTKHCKKCRNIWQSKDGDKYCKDIKCEIEGVCEIIRNGGKE